MLKILSEQLHVPYIRLATRVYDPAAVELLDKDTATRLKAMPLFRVRDDLYVAMSNPQALPTLTEIQERTGCNVRPVLASHDEIIKALGEQAVGAQFAPDYINVVDDDFEVVADAAIQDYAAIDEMAAGSPVINLVNSLIQRAVHDGASDIHIEAFRTYSRIRYRIDGTLYEFQSPRIEMHAPMVSRLKVMANLDISERRLPQTDEYRSTRRAARSTFGSHRCPAYTAKKSFCACLTNHRPYSTCPGSAWSTTISRPLS